MTRNHYNLIIRGIRGMIDQMMQPYVGQTVTVRLSAMIADEYDSFIAALREVSNSLKTDDQVFIEEDDLFDVDDAELDSIFNDPEFMAMNAAEPDEPDESTTDRSEYEAFVKSLNARKASSNG